MKLIMDLQGGFAGDMFSAALISAGADFEKVSSGMEFAGRKIGRTEIKKKKAKDNSLVLNISTEFDDEHLKGSDAVNYLDEILTELQIKEKYKKFGKNVLNILLESEREAHSKNIFIGDEYSIKPIGKHFLIEIDGEEFSKFEIFEEYSRGLKSINQFTHIFIFSFLNLSQGYSLTVSPPWEKTNRNFGLFATRSPNRPNPIGLHKIEIKEIKGNVIIGNRTDLFDNTPIIDIKPIIGSIDGDRRANDGWFSDENNDEHFDFHSKNIPHKHNDEDAYLHEAQDILIDITGACVGLQNLDIDLNVVSANELNTGRGRVAFSHGNLSVPAPATRIILEKYKIDYKREPVDGELCTPTGAAILAALNLKREKKAEINENNFKHIGKSRGTKEYDIEPLRIFLY